MISPTESILVTSSYVSVPPTVTFAAVRSPLKTRPYPVAPIPKPVADHAFVAVPLKVVAVIIPVDEPSI